MTSQSSNQRLTSTSRSWKVMWNSMRTLSSKVPTTTLFASAVLSLDKIFQRSFYIGPFRVLTTGIVTRNVLCGLEGELLSSLPLFPLPSHSNPPNSQALSQPPRADLRTQWCTIFSTFPSLSGIYTLICLHSRPGVPHNCLRSFNTFPSPTISEYHVQSVPASVRHVI